MTFTEFQFDINNLNETTIPSEHTYTKHKRFHDSIEDNPSWNIWYGDSTIRPSIHSKVELKENFPVSTHTTADFTNTIQYTFHNKPSIKLKQISRHIYIFKPKRT